MTLNQFSDFTSLHIQNPLNEKKINKYQVPWERTLPQNKIFTIKFSVISGWDLYWGKCTLKKLSYFQDLLDIGLRLCWFYKQHYDHPVKVRVSGGLRYGSLKAFAALPEEQSLLPSTHIGWLATSCNSNFEGAHTPLQVLQSHARTRAHTHT